MRDRGRGCGLLRQRPAARAFASGAGILLLLAAPAIAQTTPSASAPDAESARQRDEIPREARELEALRGERDRAVQGEAALRSELERLRAEGDAACADARWKEWATGAGLLGAGMLLGALLRGAAGRRGRSRLRF